MTSRDEVKVGKSVQNLIAGVEDVLRLAAPARDQMIGLQSYMVRIECALAVHLLYIMT
ncbi:hypothetical protein DPMN_143497 [Dreissena polymorpha]|uniref:Uncharacterized protein n=1 Tax=Dreissena polymorpha TaxID=45954 RepID=A0A9D4GGG3_DREPO|nr:hypothetical protein DPMN_143497 [Dreissena polymorpha]